MSQLAIDMYEADQTKEPLRVAAESAPRNISAVAHFSPARDMQALASLASLLLCVRKKSVRHP